jgi:hypothetical protein
VTKPEAQLKRRTRQKEGNANTDLKGIGWKVAVWINVAQDRDNWQDAVNTGMELLVRREGGNFLTSWGIIGLWKALLRVVS